VVIYADGAKQNFNATFLAYLLGGFGHPKIRVLDGGYAKWTAEGRPTSKDYPKIEATEFPAEPFDPHIGRLSLVKWVVEHTGTREGEMVLVDVRPTNQYSGEAGAQKRRGHIPGAINHVWSSDLVSNGEAKVWKPVDELRKSYESQGITPDKHVILYCNTGTEASHAYFTLHTLLGYANVDVYIPSFTEWAERDDVPIDTGQ
jgi:thiosulfate/3-mercaptopyruvate sulfurtransferase